MSLAALIAPEQYEKWSVEEARAKSWQTDFGTSTRDFSIESQEQLTEHLQRMSTNLGWNNFTEFFTAMALRFIYPEWATLHSSVEAVEPSLRLGNHLIDYAHRQTPLENAMSRQSPYRPPIDEADFNRRSDLYHDFVRGLVESWTHAGLYRSVPNSSATQRGASRARPRR
jgi:hypothetical protein